MFRSRGIKSLKLSVQGHNLEDYMMVKVIGKDD